MLHKRLMELQCPGVWGFTSPKSCPKPGFSWVLPYTGWGDSRSPKHPRQNYGIKNVRGAPGLLAPWLQQAALWKQCPIQAELPAWQWQWTNQTAGVCSWIKPAGALFFLLCLVFSFCKEAEVSFIRKVFWTLIGSAPANGWSNPNQSLQDIFWNIFFLWSNSSSCQQSSEKMAEAQLFVLKPHFLFYLILIQLQGIFPMPLLEVYWFCRTPKRSTG